MKQMESFGRTAGSLTWSVTRGSRGRSPPGIWRYVTYQCHKPVHNIVSPLSYCSCNLMHLCGSNPSFGYMSCQSVFGSPIT